MANDTNGNETNAGKWMEAAILVGCGALLIVPMGQGDPESGFFFVTGFAADYWFVQCAVALFEGRKRTGAWRRPMLLIKACLIVAIVLAAAVRGHLLEVLAITAGAALFFGALGLIGVVIFGAERLWTDRVQRKRCS